MALLTPNNTGQELTTTIADVFTVPASTARQIISINAANVDGTNDADVTVQWTDSSNADAVVRLAFEVTVEAKNARPMMVGPLVLMSGDKLQAKASAASDIELTVSYIDGAV